MHFLANENFPGAAVDALRSAGQEIAWVRTDAAGSADEEVLARAVYERCVLLTFDKDFGELAWRTKLPASCGIVLFRIPMPPANLVGKLICEILMSRDDWRGRFSVVEPGRVRMRELPNMG